jgi:hypothetical protein
MNGSGFGTGLIIAEFPQIGVGIFDCGRKGYGITADHSLNFGYGGFFCTGTQQHDEDRHEHNGAWKILFHGIKIG